MSDQIKLPLKYMKYYEEFAILVPSVEISNYTQQINDYIDKLKQKQIEFEFLNIEVAQMLAERSKYLINTYSSLDEYNKKLVVFAIKYFLNSNDEDADLTSITGFDDDVEVMNYVLISIGKPELTIDLD